MESEDTVVDRDLAEALGVNVPSLRRRVRALALHGVISPPQRFNTGNRNEAVYHLDPDDALAVLARIEAPSKEAAKALIEGCRERRLQRRVVEVSQGADLALRAEIELLRGKLAATEAERDEVARLLNERWTDNMLPAADDPRLFPERVCPARLVFGSARVMWNDSRIYLRIVRLPRHYQGRLAMDWAGHTTEDGPRVADEEPAFEDDTNHLFEGLRGIDIRTKLPIVYFNSDSHPGSIVVGFQVPLARGWDPDDYRANAEFIGRTAAGKLVI